jgi:hypothetical protein
MSAGDGGRWWPVVGSPFAANVNGTVQTYLTKLPEDPVVGQTYFYERVDLTDSLGNFAGCGFNRMWDSRTLRSKL